MNKPLTDAELDFAETNHCSPLVKRIVAALREERAEVLRLRDILSRDRSVSVEGLLPALTRVAMILEANGWDGQIAVKQARDLIRVLEVERDAALAEVARLMDRLEAPCKGCGA